MGGYGSGSWYRWDAKSTTESQHRIDARWLKKQGYLRPGNFGLLSWSRRNKQTGSIGYRMEADHMVLNYRHRPHGGEWETVEQTVSFDRTPCNYGKHRTWFHFPRCWKRIAVLYGAGKYFFCRHCYNLTYSSQQESRADRLMRKARKIRERMGGSGNLLEPFPDKPKNMHWKTYWRLHERSEHANTLSCLIMGQQLGIHF
ncbi:MAG: hypothetical protein U9N83_04055 [Thermodesulfobacteriota bacterium]|nr:hypothetical protein [Thermodesulfobacteriota bacterium]